MPEITKEQLDQARLLWKDLRELVASNQDEEEAVRLLALALEAWTSLGAPFHGNKP